MVDEVVVLEGVVVVVEEVVVEEVVVEGVDVVVYYVAGSAIRSIYVGAAKAPIAVIETIKPVFISTI